MSRRWRHLRLLPSKQRRWDGWPQGNQGQAWPSFTRQAGPSPRWAARLLPSWRRTWGPGWGQGNQGTPWPSFSRQAGSLRAPARLLPPSRRPWGPAWPQGNQGNPCPSFTRQPRTASQRGLRLLTSHGRRFDPPWVPPAPLLPPPMLRQTGPLRAPAKLLPAARRRFEPPWPQAAQGQPWPSFTRQPGIRPRWLDPRASSRRQRYFEPPWPQSVNVTRTVLFSVPYARQLWSVRTARNGA